MSLPENAWSGEEYLCKTPNGLAKFVRPGRKGRFKYDMREVDPLEAYQITSVESAEEEEREHDTSMKVDDPDLPMAETTADEPGQAERE